MERPQDVIASSDEVVRRFGNATEPDFRKLVAIALSNKIVILHQMDRPRDVLVVCDEVLRRFGAATEPVLREHVAQALTAKAVALGKLRRPRDAIPACDEIIRRFGDASELTLREAVAKALLSKSIATRPAAGTAEGDQGTAPASRALVPRAAFAAFRPLRVSLQRPDAERCCFLIENPFLEHRAC